MKTIRLHLGQFALSIYRWVGITVMYGVLLCVLSYIVGTGFYVMNTQWIIPFMVTPTNDKILDLTTKLVSSEQTLNLLIVDRDRLQNSLGGMQKMKSKLDDLDNDLQAAATLESSGNLSDGPMLDTLNQQKRIDNLETQSTLDQTAIAEDRIDKDLKVSLITKSEAAIAKMSLRQYRNLSTDGSISEILLRNTIRQKTSNQLSTIDILVKEVELKNNLMQLTAQISSGQEQLQNDISQILVLSKAIATAHNSPYFLATKGDVNFAFVPYDNQTSLQPGVNVYTCMLSMIVCHKVGTIRSLFQDEEKTISPITKTEMRGFLVQLEISDREEVKSKLLFVGHAPLFF